MNMQEAAVPKLPDVPGLRPNRACRHCVKIKAKCVPLPESTLSICQRCHRLGKNCTTPAPLIRKVRNNRTSQSANTSATVDTLTAPTLSSPQMQSSDLNVPEDSSRTVSSQSSAFTPADVLRFASPAPSDEQQPTPTRTNYAPIATDPSSNISEYVQRSRTRKAGTAFEISPEIGHAFTTNTHEKLFEQFRDNMSHFFPFATLQEDAATMRQERPFTYVTCVMSAAHRDATLQFRIVRDILKYVGEHMLLHGEKSFDLLQGFLVMISWYHVYTHSNPQLMNILHLAKALLVDLGLNKPPGTGLFQVKMSNDGITMMHGLQSDVRKHTLEERRASLALYHICAVVSACYRRLDPMPWTDYLEDCCNTLQNSPERSSDAALLALIRSDRLVDRYSKLDGGGSTLNMPIQAYVKLFSEDFESLRQNLAPSLQSDFSVNMQMHTVRLCLFERVINSKTGLSSQKVAAMYTCLSIVRQFFESFLALDNETIPNLPFLYWSISAHAFEILTKLSFIEVENWDVEYARNNPGLAAILDRIIEKFKEIQTLEQIHHPSSPDFRFKIFINRMEQYKLWFKSRIDIESKGKNQDFELLTDMSTPVNSSSTGTRLGDFADVLWQDLIPDWTAFDGFSNFPQE